MARKQLSKAEAVRLQERLFTMAGNMTSTYQPEGRDETGLVYRIAFALVTGDRAKAQAVKARLEAVQAERGKVV